MTDSAGAGLCETPEADESADAAAAARADTSTEAVVWPPVVVAAEAAAAVDTSGWDADPEPPESSDIVPAEADPAIGATPPPRPEVAALPVELAA